MIDDAAIKLRYEALDPVLDERGRRRFAAAEALAAGRGGVTAVARITGMARSTIGRGLAELRGEAAPDAAPERVRRKGGGRKPLVDTDPTLARPISRTGRADDARRSDVAAAVDVQEPAQAGGRACANWAIASATTWSAELLRELGYSLQANRKTREGTSHPDRDAQFGYINDQVKQALAAGEPAISVDTKKKELVGDFKNGGREWRPKGQPEQVRVHDFLIPELGRAAPYGVYDIADNAGWVSVGIDHDTASLRGQRHPPLVASDGPRALSRTPRSC